MEGLISQLRSAAKKHRDSDLKILATPSVPWLDESETPRAILIRWDGEQALSLVIPADPDALLEALSGPPTGEPEPLYLVCTHGSRDPCCGLVGVPVYKALNEQAGRKTLQVSHLGGHRFAPVIAAFPEWRFYGLLTPETCLEMDRALQNGEAYLNGYRGNGRLKPHLQVIEAKLWETHGNKLLRVNQLSGDKSEVHVQAELKNNSQLEFRASIGQTKYEGYKSCKDIRKEKLSTMKIPVLESLNSLVDCR